MGSGGHWDHCTRKALTDRPSCRWLLCLSQQLFQGLGAPSKTTTPANSCPLSEMKTLVGPAWQEAGGRLAPGTAAGPRTGSHAFGMDVAPCSRPAPFPLQEGLPRGEAHRTSWEKQARSSGTGCVSSPSPDVSTKGQGCLDFLKQAFPWHEKEGPWGKAEKSWWIF